MNTFNLIISTNRTYEQYAEREIWFVISILGDSSPFIMHSPIPGILLVNTKLDPYLVIKKMRTIMRKEHNFFKYILRITPVDRVVETNIDLIHHATMQIFKSKKRIARKYKSFAIQVKKRAAAVSRSEIIDKIVPEIPNRVDLKNPGWVLHYEIIGNMTGISLMKESDIFRIVPEQKNLVSSKN